MELENFFSSLERAKRSEKDRWKSLQNLGTSRSTRAFDAFKGASVQKLTVHRSVEQIAPRYFNESMFREAIDEVRKFPRKHISKRRLTSRRRFTGGRVNNSISRSRVSANPPPRRHSFSDKLINRVHQSERTCVMAVPKTFVTHPNVIM